MIRKAIQSAFLLLAVAMFVSCSKGVKAEPLIGLSYSYNGLFVGGVKLYNANTNTQLKNKEIKLGETLYISIEKLTGFTAEDGKINPACKVTVTDPEGNVVLSSEDIYAEQEQPQSNLDNFSVTIKMGSPIVAGKEYVTTANLYDKKSPENKIDITVTSKVIE